MGPAKFLNRRFGFGKYSEQIRLPDEANRVIGGSFFNKFDGSPDLLDDLDGMSSLLHPLLLHRPVGGRGGVKENCYWVFQRDRY